MSALAGGGRPVAVVTGASRGIGRALCARLARDYDVVGVARSAEKLAAVQREIEAAGARFEARAADVGDASAVARALDGVRADVLVNNAGVFVSKPFLELAPEDWSRMVRTNVDALFHVTRALLPGMVERRRGHVVNIGSIAGRSAFVGGSCYAATKAAVTAFSESLMLEVRDAGVRVSVVMPGSVATDMSRHADKSWMVPPEEVAESVAYLLAAPAGTLVHRLEIRPAVPKK